MTLVGNKLRKNLNLTIVLWLGPILFPRFAREPTLQKSHQETL